jgi:hypothetical protein
VADSVSDRLGDGHLDPRDIRLVVLGEVGDGVARGGNRLRHGGKLERDHLLVGLG